MNIERIQRGRQLGFDNMLIVQNVYYALTQLGFYDKPIHNVLDRHGFHTEQHIRRRYLSTAKYVRSVYNPNYDIESLANDTNKIRKIHGSVNDTITQQMYSDVLLVFCTPIYFFDLYGIHVSEDDKLCFIELWAFIGKELGIKPEYNVCQCALDEYYRNDECSLESLYMKKKRMIKKYIAYCDGSNKIHQLFVKHVNVPFMFIQPTEIFKVNPYLKFLCNHVILMQMINWTMLFLLSYI